MSIEPRGVYITRQGHPHRIPATALYAGTDDVNQQWWQVLTGEHLQPGDTIAEPPPGVRFCGFTRAGVYRNGAGEAALDEGEGS